MFIKLTPWEPYIFTSFVQKLVNGAHRLTSSFDSILPITVDILIRLIDSVNSITFDPYAQILFKALFLFVFSETITEMLFEKKWTFERKKNNPKERNLINQMDIWAKKKDFWTKCYVLVPRPLARLMFVAPCSPRGGGSGILSRIYII